jgi:hypothetical protein
MSALPLRRVRTRTVVGFSLLAAVLLLAGANAHLLYVAVTSQPECVDHAREGDANKGQVQGSFRAAKSSCSPGARS